MDNPFPTAMEWVVMGLTSAAIFITANLRSIGRFMARLHLARTSATRNPHDRRH